MVRALPWGEPRQAFLARCSAYRLAELVKHARMRVCPWKPKRLQVGDRTNHDPHPVFIGEVDDPVVIIVDKPSLGGFHPASHSPKLHRVGPGVFHSFDIFWPIICTRSRGSVILRAEQQGDLVIMLRFHSWELRV